MADLFDPSKHEVLVVDDTTANVKLLAEILEEQGYQVRAAINGEMALQSIALKTPDLILLDIKMPGMNGFEVSKHLKSAPETQAIPIIFISAMNETEDKLNAFRAGGQDYMTKPFANEEVIARVRTHLQLHDYQQHLKHKIEEGVQEIRTLNQELEATQGEIITMLGSTIEERSNEAGQHVVRVAEYAYLLAKLYGIDAKTCELIRKAAPMHDIGKVAIPDQILNKPGPLTIEERAIMETHAQKGYDILKGSTRSILQVAASIAYQHHEKWNGTGYPQGLKEEDIDVCGRICAVADVFDALGNDRVYKAAWPLEQILDYFKEESGKSFEPKMIDLFFQHLDEFLAIRDKIQD
ncbi:HD-GYP domain-containing protein [Hydrogenovibrio kuenenii]|uniref:HD-GYP domain-containing protein n=1 Tax=Hydrogenovibrio kuenenii TaxID=63658 RepID=UPI0004668EE0|nr:HD domain-containing phosphohydrolase [Hydrogenovibrio kuenenii]